MEDQTMYVSTVRWRVIGDSSGERYVGDKMDDAYYKFLDIVNARK